MPTQVRSPTSDIELTGTWTGSAGSRYTLVDDYPDTVPTDYLDHGTTAGSIVFGFSPFTVPAGATGISVQVRYYDRDVTSGTNNIRSRIRAGTVPAYLNSASHNPSTTLTARQDSFSNNPKTSAPWTVDEVNGIGANGLTGFGWLSSDASPAIRLSCIQIQVTYTEPAGVSGELVLTLDAIGIQAAGTVGSSGVSGVLDRTLDALILAASGHVPIAGQLDKALDPLGLSVIGQVPISGQLARTLDDLGLAAAGQVPISGALIKALEPAGLAAAGMVGVAGVLECAIGTLAVEATGLIGSVPIEGQLAVIMESIALAATGTVATEEIEAPAPAPASTPGWMLGMVERHFRGRAARQEEEEVVVVL